MKWFWLILFIGTVGIGIYWLRPATTSPPAPIEFKKEIPDTTQIKPTVGGAISAAGGAPVVTPAPSLAPPPSNQFQNNPYPQPDPQNFDTVPYEPPPPPPAQSYTEPEPYNPNNNNFQPFEPPAEPEGGNEPPPPPPPPPPAGSGEQDEF